MFVPPHLVIGVANFSQEPPDYTAALASAYYGCERCEDAIAVAKAALDLDESNLESRLV